MLFMLLIFFFVAATAAADAAQSQLYVVQCVRCIPSVSCLKSDD